MARVPCGLAGSAATVVGVVYDPEPAGPAMPCGPGVATSMTLQPSSVTMTEAGQDLG